METSSIESGFNESRIITALRPLKAPLLSAVTVSAFASLTMLVSSFCRADLYREDFKAFAIARPIPHSPALALGQEIEFLATYTLANALVGAITGFTIGWFLMRCKGILRPS